MEYHGQTKSKSQMRKLKIFQLNQKNFAAIGLNSAVVAQQYAFNEKLLLGILILIFSGTCNLMYTVCEAKTFSEYTQSIYMCSLTTLISLVLLIVIFNVKKLFGFVNDCENFANTSESEKSKFNTFHST